MFSALQILVTRSGSIVTLNCIWWNYKVAPDTISRFIIVSDINILMKLGLFAR